ncbi:MAG: hemolysin family protein [Acidimicrobiia bacterium]|nr:hemolysin family protein [Acidimicrobiia bacterium]
MDVGTDLPAIVGLLVSIGAAIFLAAAETALLRIPAARAATLAVADQRGQRVAGLVERLPEVLNTVLLAALLSQIAAATLTGILAARWFGNVGVTIASVVLTVVLFVYAEAIPKTFAVRHADSVALRLAFPVTLLERFLHPLVAGLVWVADLQMPGQGITTSPTVTEDELRFLADRAVTEGEITVDDRELIERAFRVGDRHADDIMVPRPDIVAVGARETIDEALQVALARGHRRLPVIENSIDEVVGVVGLRSLVTHRGSDLRVRDLAADALVVPESKAVLDLLTEMQDQHQHLAIVVDEYGGTAGLVTIEDVVEELVGSVSEDLGAAAVHATETGWLIDGALPVEDLVELIGDIPEGDWNTAAGLIMGVTGRIPELGDEISVEGGRLRVTGTRGRRITRIEVRADD